MSITLIIGPMFSGKTSELIRLVDRKRIAGKKCLIIKHTNDIRYDDINDNTDKIDNIVTHSHIQYSKTDIIKLSELLNDIQNNIIEKKTYDTVAIEEGHFFPNINTFCTGLANNGIDVIVSAIDSSFKQEMFKNIGELIANSEIVMKLTAICMVCKDKDAHFNIRTVSSNEEILVGGADIYKSVCRTCMINSQK